MLVMFLDLTVVYFAFGAPLGVYEITRNKRSPRTVVLAAMHFVLWPLFAVASLRRSFAVERPEPSLEQEVDDLRAEFEAAAFDGRKSDAVLEFRDLYAHYSGLAIALGRAGGYGTSELFAVGSHPDANLASRCLERRNRNRLEFHLFQARNEFEEAVAKLTRINSNIGGLTKKLDVLLDAGH